MRSVVGEWATAQKDGRRVRKMDSLPSSGSLCQKADIGAFDGGVHLETARIKGPARLLDMDSAKQMPDFHPIVSYTVIAGKFYRRSGPDKHDSVCVAGREKYGMAALVIRPFGSRQEGFFPDESLRFGAELIDTVDRDEF